MISTRSLPRSQVLAVDVGDLQLAARRRLQVRGDVDDLVVVEVEPRHGEMGSRRGRLLLDRSGAARPCRTRPRRSARGPTRVGEDGGAARAGAGRASSFGRPWP